MLKRPLIFLLFLSLASCAWGQVKGFISDENKSALPGANILLLPDSLWASSDIDGRFSFTDLPDNSYKLVVSYIGYQPDTLFVRVKNGRSREARFRLQPSDNLLEIIEVTEEHAKQEETLHTEHIHEDFFQKNLEGSFAKSIEKLPGISAINVGVGIAKPVIRGLSANRIIVNHQGINHQRSRITPVWF